MYLNPGMHKAITGGKVVISARPGSMFSAFNGMLRGRMLYTIPGRLIVQAWRKYLARRARWCVRGDER